MASNSILKLQVDDRQYEASLKSAQQGLQALMNALRNSGKSFSDLDKNTEQYVRALGNMEATAKTTRGRIGEMSSAFVELSQVEKQLTDQERQSPVGKALTESLDQLKQRTIEAKKELADLDKQLTSQKAPETNGGGLLSKLGGKMDGALAVFGGNLMTKAAGMGVGLVTEMTDAVKQGIELAKAGEGVRIAFERLGRGDILQGLREATHGTVTDLELMKAAVKFNDFKLPVEELGTMLAFAQQKAKDTGQSVDYMVDSIVTGLGRKSLMILDNLGLSASEIRERMKETGDMTKAVGAIIREQMAAAGEYVETAADRAAQANVSLQNKMEELGRKFAPVEEASNQLWTSIKIGILDIIGGPLARLLNELTEAGRQLNAMNDVNGNDGSGQSLAQRRLNTLREYSGSQKGVTKQTVYDRTVARYAKEEEQAWRKANEFAEKYKNTLKELDNVNPRTDEKGVQASALQQQANKYKQQQEKYTYRAQAIRSSRAEYERSAQNIIKPVKVNVNTQQAETNVKKLRQQLKELEEQRKKAVKAGDQEQVENLTKQISQVKTNIGYLDPSANKTGSSSKTAQTELQENQAKINTLTQEYVKLGDDSTDAARKRQEEIQKEIQLLQQRNGLLGKRAEQAQGRLLSNDDIKRKAEIDMQVNTKQIEDLRRQLTEIDGVTIDPKSVTITATDEALPKLRDIQGVTIDDKTMTVTAETAEALRALQGIEGVTIDPKSVTITATDEALPKLREIQGINIDDKTMTVTAETADALRALQGIDGVTIDPKSVTITATDEALSKLREIQGVTIDDKTMTVTAETAEALRALQGIEGVTIDPKTVTITATDEALSKLREIQGVTIDDKTMTVTAETADALQALQGIEGVAIDPKTIEVNANTSEAQQKIDELKAKIAELEDKNINIKAFVESIGKPLGEGLNNTTGTLLKAPETNIPRGGLLLDDKDMKAVRKNIDDSLPKAEKKENPMEGSKKMLNAISQLTGGLQQMGIELPSEIQGVIGVIQGAMQVIEAVNTIIGVTQTSALTANTAAMISLEAALWANTSVSWIPFANGGVVPGFSNGGVIDSGHSPSFLSFSKAAPAFATGGVVPQTITSIPKFATGGIIQKFNDGGTVEAGHAPDFLSFSKAMPKFATGGVIQKFNDGGTVEANHAPDFLSFSKAMPKRFATGGVIPHANGGYFVGGTHYSSDVTPIMANAGELILNKVQQNTLAGMLSTNEGIGNLNLTATIKGEQIRLALNNNGRRTGRGEYVQSRNVR